MDEHYPPSIPEQQRLAGMQPQQAALENARHKAPYDMLDRETERKQRELVERGAISPQTYQNMIGQRVKPPLHAVFEVCARQLECLGDDERLRVLRALAALFGIEEL